MSMKVLVVDDNPVNCAIAKGMLKSLQCEAYCAANGEEALAACAADHYDLVLMDCDMPVMDGLTATALIRQREASTNAPRLPIIALTANTESSLIEKCVQAGMDDYHTKPIKLTTLVQILTRWADRQPKQALERGSRPTNY